MHTVETAVVIPLLLLLLLGGIFLSLRSVALVEAQNQFYESAELKSRSCLDVLRQTEVVYETITSLTES